MSDERRPYAPARLLDARRTAIDGWSGAMEQTRTDAVSWSEDDGST